MQRKRVQGEIRDKEKTQQKLLDTVDEIFKTQGHSGLKVNNVAAKAGVDKKLIYTYFGSMDGLIDTYIHSKDFWHSQTLNDKELVNQSKEDQGKELVTNLLVSQLYEYLTNPQLRHLNLWELSEQNPLVWTLAKQRENQGNKLFTKITDRHFGKEAKHFRALIALLISGIYYLTIHSETNGITFCGIDIQKPQGKKLFEETLKNQIDLFYKNSKSAN